MLSFLLKKAGPALLLFGLIMSGFLKPVQAQTIKGVIKDAISKEPLAGATIRQVGTNSGAVSREDGSFDYRLRDRGQNILAVNFLGYNDLRVDLKNRNLNLELEIFLYPETYIGEDVFVEATRVDESTPLTYTNLEREEIEKRNLGQDVPYLLQNLPSVTTTSDAGAGIGYTGIRIRGVDPARINVTINGIPVNDAESHGVFWVDLPDLASSVQNIQVQRGVGTSTNGSGAFGATINLQTSTSSPDPFGEVNTGFGSFNTRKFNVKLGSGLMQNGWQFEGRLSSIDSDGFIDRASSDLQSFFLSAARHGENSLLRADVFTGKEITYQAWYGVEESVLQNDRTFNEAGTEKEGNPYDDQVDNYQQNYYQLHYSYHPSNNWDINTSLFYTKGFGYFEEYKADENLANYDIQPLNPSDPSSSDLVRRRWLDNDFYGLIFSSNLKASADWKLTLGGSYKQYDGAHYGEVIWARFAGDSEIEDRYYDNNGNKTDGNIYAKLKYNLSDRWISFADVQLRSVHYEFLGFGYTNQRDQNDELIPVNLRQDDRLLFFNPKAGITFRKSPNERFYASISVGNKEPTREEYVNSTEESRPKHESLYNLETGFNGDYGRYYVGANFYTMYYKDQLVLTGKVNDVGAYIRQNVPDSYRLGLEVQGGVQIHSNVSLGLNATFSRNKINEYTRFVDQYDEQFNYLGQTTELYENTDIAFSPDLITNAVIGYQKGNLNAEWVSKYVSRQYLDNTQNSARSIDPYWVNDLRVVYSFGGVDLLRNLVATLQINNVLNHEYETNGYTFGWQQAGNPINFNYYYPQAGTNWLLQLKWEF